jgi:hypothetical protein
MNNQGPKDKKGKRILHKLNLHAHILADVIEFLATAPLVHQPAMGFNYSQGPDVVGRLVEIFSGKPLEVLVRV